MKTIEYPIKEMVSFEMDKKGRWWLKCKLEHSHLKKMNRKMWRELDYQINRFCEEDGRFLILNESYFQDSYLPQLVFPKTIMHRKKS